MRRLLIAGALLTLAGCAAAPTEAEGNAAEDRVEAIDEILSQPMEQEDYAKAERCLSTHTYRTARVLDDQHVLFEGTGGRAWLNRLRYRCVGLRPNSTLRFRLRENRACDMDSFESIDSFLGVLDRSSATCSLGQFMPVTPEQVEAVKAAVAEKAR